MLRPASAQAQQLAAIPSSIDGICEYRPCQVTLVSDDVVDRVVILEADSYLTAWGVWPADDPAKQSVAIEEVTQIADSPVRLPAGLANQLYVAGESGMGYVVYTVVLRDGRHLPFVTGNLVDFPALPRGVGTGNIVDVLAHQGPEQFRCRAPYWHQQSAPYHWCLFRCGLQS